MKIYTTKTMAQKKEYTFLNRAVDKTTNFAIRTGKVATGLSLIAFVPWSLYELYDKPWKYNVRPEQVGGGVAVSLVFGGLLIRSGLTGEDIWD
jgi:hypothetical protein